MSVSARHGEYLRITISDNDFINSLEMVGKLLQNIFQFEGEYPNEENLPELRESIQNIWYGVHKTICLMENRFCPADDFTYLRPNLKFVQFENIPEWDNYESVYIPMFDGEILVR